MSYAAVAETYVNPHPAPRRPLARPNVLLASLAAAVVATGFSVAAVGYALTHVPEVDPAAQPTPVGAIARIAAEVAANETAKLQVLTPPVYGPGVVSVAPAAPFVPVNAQVKMDAVDLQKLAEADDVGAPQDAGQPCDDPCSAQTGYVAEDASDEAGQLPVPRATQVAGEDEDDGNAPPPPDMAVN